MTLTLGRTPWRLIRPSSRLQKKWSRMELRKSLVRSAAAKSGGCDDVLGPVLATVIAREKNLAGNTTDVNHPLCSVFQSAEPRSSRRSLAKLPAKEEVCQCPEHVSREIHPMMANNDFTCGLPLSLQSSLQSRLLSGSPSAPAPTQLNATTSTLPTLPRLGIHPIKTRLT
jgi:hypothetical protein